MLFSSDVTASIQNAAKDAGIELLDNACDRETALKNAAELRLSLAKKPADYHIWLQSGTPPAFLREEGPLYERGPIWRNETQISPTFTH